MSVIPTAWQSTRRQDQVIFALGLSRASFRCFSRRGFRNPLTPFPLPSIPPPPRLPSERVPRRAAALQQPISPNAHGAAAVPAAPPQRWQLEARMAVPRGCRACHHVSGAKWGVLHGLLPATEVCCRGVTARCHAGARLAAGHATAPLAFPAASDRRGIAEPP